MAHRINDSISASGIIVIPGEGITQHEAELVISYHAKIIAVMQEFDNHGFCPNCGCDQWNTQGCPTCPTMRRNRDLLASLGLREPRKYAAYAAPESINDSNIRRGGSQ